MVVDTRLTEMFGIEQPVVLAPMPRWADAGLASAVCRAGGLGAFGAWPGFGIDEQYVRDTIAAIRRETDLPFGAGFLTHDLPRSRRHLEVALEERVPAVLLSFDDPTPWVPLVHEAGARVLCQIQSRDHARRAVDAGADVVCVQGVESGGHTGPLSLLPTLVWALESFPDTPILAAGGISTGRALAAVLGAGADGAWIGTAFLAAHEATFQPSLAEAIVRSDGSDTRRSRVIDLVTDSVDPNQTPWPSNIALRSQPNEFIERWDGREAELATDTEALSAARRGLMKMDPNVMPMVFGEGAGAVRRQASVADVLEDMTDDAQRLLSRFAP
jgi:nitronate monooxygenase